jgi:hypothetical protein
MRLHRLTAAHAFLAVGAFAALAAAQPAAAQSATPQPEATPTEPAAPRPTPAAPAVLPAAITVSGTGEVTVTPDRARVLIGAETLSRTAAEAATQNAATQRAVVAAIRATGIPPSQITTSGYTVAPEQVYDTVTRRPRITGYRVQHTITVDVALLAQTGQIGAVLDAALAHGATTIASLTLYVADDATPRREALARAVQRAREDATAMAIAAGGQLGELLEIATGASETAGPRPMFALARADGIGTTVAEGTQTITATVTARWRFVAGRSASAPSAGTPSSRPTSPTRR